MCMWTRVGVCVCVLNSYIINPTLDRLDEPNLKVYESDLISGSNFEIYILDTPLKFPLPFLKIVKSGADVVFPSRILPNY